MISKDEVGHIAKLARLGLTDKEMEKYQKDLSSILDYIEKLETIDITGIDPTSQSVLIENIMRNDEERPSDIIIVKKIMDNAPETKEGFLKVKPVF